MRTGVGAAHAALVVGGALAALLVVEGLLRLCPALAGPLSTPAEKIYFARYDPELGWAPRPLVTGIHRDDGFSVFVSQNAWGLRAAADVGPARRVAGRRRILVLGDSYVWGYGAAQHELFTDPAVAGDGVDLVNFGVSGYGTDQELLFYRRLGTRFDVDEVALIRTLRNEVRAHGAAFSVVFVPYYPHIVAGAPENHPFVPLLASALFAAHIPYYEPYWLFLEASRGGPPLFNALDNHFSAAGHRVFARVFVDPAVRAATRDLYQRRAALGSLGRKWSHLDSNQGPPACEAGDITS